MPVRVDARDHLRAVREWDGTCIESLEVAQPKVHLEQR